MAVLQIKDKDGNFIPIPAVKGNDGKSAYEQAKEGGYVGTEEEFIALLNGLTASGDADHYADFNNPHRVTAVQTGAIPEIYNSTYDLNTELQQGGGKFKVCCYNEFTQNSPYTEGLTDCTHGMVITNAFTSEYSTQICTPSGEDSIYVRRLNGQGISAWVQMANAEQLNDYFERLNDHIEHFNVYFATAEAGGAAAGFEATVEYGRGFAGGLYAKAEAGGAVGSYALSDGSGFAGGEYANAISGGAVGYCATTGYGFAGGFEAKTIDASDERIDAIQLGEGTNPTPRTLQVYDYPLMDAFGNIVPDRLPTAAGSYKGTNTYGVSKPNTLTFDFVPKIVVVSQRGERNATGGGAFIWINAGSTLNFINNGSNYWVHPTLESTTLSWYCAESASYQLNSSNYTYDYFAWG